MRKTRVLCATAVSVIWCQAAAIGESGPAGVLSSQAVEASLGEAGGSGGLPLGQGGGSSNVEVIVSSSLYAGGQITAALNQYLDDLRAQGYGPVLTVGSFSSPGELRGHLAGRYYGAGLAGTVLIGQLPWEHFEIDGQFGDPNKYERFGCDLYYMDLDGTWSDLDGNGTYDAHAGAVSPEIWLGRLTTAPLTGLHAGRTEAGLLNEYFQKNHAYRRGRLALPEGGLAYVDDDWIPWAGTWAGALGVSVDGGVDVVSDGATTTAEDYANRLTTTPYESVLLAAHSSAIRHSFKIGSEFSGGRLYSAELAGLDPQVLFYNLFACFSADYEADGYMAGEYVFGTQCGLLAVGSTKTGSMLSFGDYYSRLGQGKTFGEALLDWWLARAIGGFSPSEREWHYGMTLLGDPLLLTQTYVPEPKMVALWFLGGLALIHRRAQRACRPSRHGPAGEGPTRHRQRITGRPWHPLRQGRPSRAPI